MTRIHPPLPDRELPPSPRPLQPPPADDREGTRSRIPGFYKYSVSERQRALYERGLISEADYHFLAAGGQVLDAEAADRLIENVVGVFSLPMALGLNFRINARDYVVPFVVEEPSILAAVSSAAMLARRGGGFEARCDESLLIGQVQLVGVADPEGTCRLVLDHTEAIVNLANSLHPRMVARGGGAREVEAKVVRSKTTGAAMVVVHLLVDTRDAMGANAVNTMCEGVAPLIEKLTGGKVFLRILSNLTDRSLVRARVVIPAEALEGRGYAGEAVRDAIIAATDFAAADPYRAATHNKGILNGVDAVALATGNDWRAIEAAAHAFAARGGAYTSLTSWCAGERGELIGELEMPLKVGLVGSQIESNPAVALAHRILGVGSARELAEVMAAVGLAQNLAALRALSTEGIQRGHMTLHARSCAVAAGATPELFDRVVDELVESGEVKTWKAREILHRLGGCEENQDTASEMPLPAPGAADEPGPIEPAEGDGVGHGKVILFGEHAVVYGSRAVAAPLPLAIRARARAVDEESRLVIPRWGVEQPLTEVAPDTRTSLRESVALILRELHVAPDRLRIEVFPHVPRAMGMGASAALAVAIIRAVAAHAGIAVRDAEVNRIAFLCEQIAHGTPSGVDNTLATYGRFILFRKGTPPVMEDVHSPRPLPLVVGVTGVESLTARMVAKVAAARQAHPEPYERVFAEIDRLAGDGLEAIQAGDLPRLGELMNLCHGYLNALQVSSPELEKLVSIARANGALGAKLTGGGGGGAMVALCPDDGGETARVVAGAMREAGYRALHASIGGEGA